MTDQYSHILDENRRINAELIEKAFYAGKSSEPDIPSDCKKTDEESTDEQETLDPTKLVKILSNPDVLNMLKVISKSVS